MKSAKEIRDMMRYFTGTENYHVLTIYPGIVGTDGVKEICIACECFWLIDLIASYQPKIMKHKNAAELAGLQCWKLSKNDDKWVAICTDGNNNVAIKQEIEHSDFPLDEGIEMWVAPGEYSFKGKRVVGKVIYLPSEH